MDDRKFDRFSREMVSGRSRRDAIKLLFGGVAAIAIGNALTGDASAQSVCSLFGEDCIVDSDCCAGLACLGICTPSCASLLFPCETDGDCCAGLVCNASDVCANPPTCAPEAASCASDGDCCDDLTCSSGYCASVPTCGVETATCQSDADCCKDLVCPEGTCTNLLPVPQPDTLELPDTGSGSAGSRVGSAKIGIALASGVAALAGYLSRKEKTAAES